MFNVNCGGLHKSVQQRLSTITHPLQLLNLILVLTLSFKSVFAHISLKAGVHLQQETKVFISPRHSNGKAYLSWIQTQKGGGGFESSQFPAPVHGGEFESEVHSNTPPLPTISQPQYMVESLNLNWIQIPPPLVSI